MSNKLNYLLKAPRQVFNIMGSHSRALVARNTNKPDWFVNRPAIDVRDVAPDWKGWFLQTGNVPVNAPAPRRRFVCTIGRA